ncbi:MAG: OmpA family protein [Alphaproteobacteria bacterium]|nr:OmpA family protein [Alphaproteobacteria bacterium]
MNKKLIGLSGLLVSGVLCQGCTYNSIYEPWFDENAPLYEEDVIRQKNAAKASAESQPESKSETPTEASDIKMENESEDSGFFDWLFNNNDEEEIVVNVPHIPEDEIVHSENKSYVPQTELDESSTDLVYDESITRQEVTVVRPLENPAPKVAPKAEPAPVATEKAPEVKEAKAVVTATPESPAPKAAPAVPVTVANAPTISETIEDEEEFVEIPIAILTNQETSPAPKAEPETQEASVHHEPTPIVHPTHNGDCNGKPTPLYTGKPVPPAENPPYFVNEEALIVSSPALYQDEKPYLPQLPVQHSAAQNTLAPLDTLAAKLPPTGPAVSFMTSNIPYLTESDKLDSKDKASLEDTADLCNEYNCTVRLIVHADTTVSPRAPELSASRAANIKKQLRTHGIKDSRIITELVADEYAGDFAEVFIEY